MVSVTSTVTKLVVVATRVIVCVVGDRTWTALALEEDVMTVETRAEVEDEDTFAALVRKA